MKARETLCVLVLGLVLGCSRSKGGYPGVAWGSPENPWAVERGLHCIDLVGSGRHCTGKGRIGNVSVTENFTFTKDGLRSVLLEARPEDFVALKDFFNRNYGKSHVAEQVFLDQVHRSLEWETETTNISLQSGGESGCVAVFVSKAALRREAEVKP
jgi:hypothetical protein